MSVWDDVVGQLDVVAELQAAVSAANDGVRTSGMTHAWLITGPPGSGRSTAARAFAAALLCERAGCGECLSCRTALAGSSPDVTLIATDQSQLRVDPIREYVRRAALAPAGSRWQVLIVEDADRLNDKAADALLKSIEEPPPRTVWVLCAPTAEDIVPTLRSRCRSVLLRTPATTAVAAHLTARDGVPGAIATFAARAALGHIGRARALALDERVRNRRREVLRVPGSLRDLGSCLTCAANLLEAATEEAQPRIEALDAADRADHDLVYGVHRSAARSASSLAGSGTASATATAAAGKELQRNQKQRAKRMVRDALDRSLLDLASYYRDVLAVQVGSTGSLVNEELRDEVAAMARATSAETSTRRIVDILDTRKSLETEIAPLLALERLMIELRAAGGN